MSRPPGVAALAALLAWSGVGALFVALALLAGANQATMIGVQRMPTILAAVGFGLTAGWSAAGLWRAAPWSHTALTVWAVVANVWTILFLVMMARAGRLPLPVPIFVGATLPFLALPWLLVRFARRQIPAQPR